MRYELVRLSSGLTVNQNVRARGIVIPHVARYVLMVPVHLAGVGVPGDQAVGVEVVARSVVRVIHRDWVAGAPEDLVRGRVIGPGHPHGAAASLPSVVVVLPGLSPLLAGRRNHVLTPDELAGRRVKRHDEIANSMIATGSPQDDLVFDGQWG